MNYTAKILKTLRTQANMSQAELAMVLGISRSAVASYENGTRKPNHEILLKLANFFNVSTDFLLGREQLNFKSHEIISFFTDLENLLESSNLSNNDKKEILSELKEYLCFKITKAQSD